MFFNEFRLVGDCLHDCAILLLIFNIIKTRSCYSVSGITSILYLITFSCRYLDLFPPYYFPSDFAVTYNRIFKVFYILTSIFILFLVYGLFRNTRDKLHSTFPIFGYFIGAHILNWSTCYITGYKEIDKEFFWRFSIYLEMFAIIPQLHLIYKQGMIDKIMTYYLMMLGSYRAFYILNWFYRYKTENYWEPIGFFCGCGQTIIYLYFFVRIYPQLNMGNKYQAIGVTKDVNSIIDIKETVHEKIKCDVPLIHTVV